MSKTPRAHFGAVLAGLLLALYGCSYKPVKRAQSLCPECRPVILAKNSDWPLPAYTRNLHDASEFLHIYLEGDGRAFINARLPRANPSSKKLTALRLMRQDTQASVYINRPCYGTATLAPQCETRLWTSARYSETVVDALNRAISDIKSRAAAEKLVLMGHSGGGALAMLLAKRREDVRAVVTLAANLDHAAWTQALDYSPLDESLNPNDLPALPAAVLRWHFAGGRDQLVPAHLIAAVASGDRRARFHRYPDFDHSCCWQSVWPTILADLRRALTDSAASQAP